MNIIKSVCISTVILTAPTLYAQTANTNQTQAYGDNPNIFKVIAHKTGSAIQNTAEKVGNATEKGIQKIKPQFDETVENTKSYTTQQASIARDHTRQGIDTAVKKVEQTKDKIIGKTSSNIPIQQGSLSQSSTPPNSTIAYAAPKTTAIVTEAAMISQPTQQQTPNTPQAEPEITKQSLPIEKSSSSTDSNAVNSTDRNSANTKNSEEDESDLPR